MPAGRVDATKPRSHTVSLILGVALAALAIAWFSLTFDRGFNLRDEGYLLHMSARVAAGEVPHRDFVEAYGPGVFTTTAVALEAGRFQIRPVRAWLAAVKTLAVLLVFAVLLRLTPPGVSFVGALFAIVFFGRASLNMNTPHAALYTVPFGLASVLLLLRASVRPRPMQFLAVGIGAGAALLFKQSLAAMLAYGLGLAILALAWLHPGDDDDGRETTPSVALPALVWIAAGAALVIPVAPFLTPRDYLIHLLPIHLLMAVVAYAVVRKSVRPNADRVLRRRILPFALGIGAMLLPVALLYASWGALGDLLYGMFVFPRSLRHYYLPVTLPRPAFALFGVTVTLAVASALAAVARKQRAAFAAGLTGAASLLAALLLWSAPTGAPTLPDRLWRTASIFDWILPTVLVVASSIAVLRSEGSKRSDDAAKGLVVLAFFQAFLCFQIFPRAGHNVWMVQGAMVPLATLLAYRAQQFAVGERTGLRARAAATAICLVLPLWLAAPVVADVARPYVDGSSARRVGLPHTRGIMLDGDDRRRMRIDDVRGLVRHLRRTGEPGAPLLVIGNQQMLYFVSDRAHLVPEREFLIYSAASGMIPSSEVPRLGDDEIAQRLTATPGARVVLPEDPSADRLLALLPAVERTIAGRYEIEARFGPYVVWRPRNAASDTGLE